MKKLFLFIFLLPVVSYGQLRERVEFNQADLYYGEYSEIYEQPLWVEYTLNCFDGDEDRVSSWKLTPGIHTSDDDDYSKEKGDPNDTYDKGHLAHAAGFNCSPEMMQYTNYYINSAYQHRSLNRGVWKELERFERDLANIGRFNGFTVTVRVDVLFEGELKTNGYGVTIPSGFLKTITWGSNTNKFKFPNGDTKGTDWIDYRIN